MNSYPTTHELARQCLDATTRIYSWQAAAQVLAKALLSEKGECLAKPYSPNGGASQEQRWQCEECGDVTDTTRCPKGRQNSTLAHLAEKTEMLGDSTSAVSPSPITSTLPSGVASDGHIDKREKGPEPTDREEVKRILQRACDRDWKDETLYQTAVIASNAIYWRGMEIKNLKEQLSATRAKLPSLPEEIQEWCWHMDTALEQDDRHAAMALRAAWPAVSEWLRANVRPTDRAGTPYVKHESPDA